MPYDCALSECCEAAYTPPEGLDEAAVVALMPLASTDVPIADNEVDAAIRTGQVGTSVDYVRADHNHPIRRQQNPGDPVLTGTNLTINNGPTILDRWSTEETYEYALNFEIWRQVSAGMDRYPNYRRVSSSSDRSQV